MATNLNKFDRKTEEYFCDDHCYRGKEQCPGCVSADFGHATWREQANEVLPPTNEHEEMFHGFYGWSIRDEEDVLGAVMDIFNQPHHAMFIRVEHTEDEGWKATKDPYDRLNEVYNLYDGVPLIPVQIPGIDGHWMVVIHPFGD